MVSGGDGGGFYVKIVLLTGGAKIFCGQPPRRLVVGLDCH